MKKERIIDGVKIGILLLLFFRVSRVIGIIFRALGFDTSTFNNSDMVYVNLLIDLILITVVFIFYYKNLGDDFNKVKKGYWKYFDKLLRFFGICLFVKIVASFASSFLGIAIGLKDITSDNQNTIGTLSNVNPLLMVLLSCVFAPITEECIFRLGFRKVIKDNYVFMAVSGLVFGLMHVFPTHLTIDIALVQGIVYVAMGVFLAYVYLDTDNIWTSIGVHALNNILSMVMILFL